MDFDIATRRLQRDQQTAYARVRASQKSQKASASARRAAAATKQNAERRLLQKKLENERNDKIVDQMHRLIRRVERELGVMNVASASGVTAAAAAVGPSVPSPLLPTPSTKGISSSTEEITTGSNNAILSENKFFAKGFNFSATSIHGVGDKITLPPSVLETIFASSSSADTTRNGRPIAFRIGVRNTNYIFPSSDKMKILVENVKQKVMEAVTASNDGASSSEMEMQESTPTKIDDDDDGDNEEMEEDETFSQQFIEEAYMDELSHRYLSYTHGTVVEFTEEDGHVGLPEPVAKALLQPNLHSLIGRMHVDIPVKRTVDAATIRNADGEDHDQPKDSMDLEATPPDTIEGENNEDKTPGHPAYGLFDIPALPIEIIPIHNLPPGKQCTFTPTLSSIQNGFYSIKDVKLVLEQSLMRTRATLSRGDVIRTWRRGVSYDLIVSTLKPDKFGVVSCVNTDMNVDIGPPDDENTGSNGGVHDTSCTDKAKNIGNRADALGGGRLLSEESTHRPPPSPPTGHAPKRKSNNEVVLPPEPGEDLKVGVCNIQIRGRTSSGSMTTGRRRFLIGSSTMKELFAFASQSCCDGADPLTFRLVTRFPRRVFALSSSSLGDGEGADGGRAEEGCIDGNMTLEGAGIGQGQEMFMVEMI